MRRGPRLERRSRHADDSLQAKVMQIRNKHVLITGGAGFIGSHLVKHWPIVECECSTTSPRANALTWNARQQAPPGRSAKATCQRRGGSTGF